MPAGFAHDEWKLEHDIPGGGPVNVLVVMALAQQAPLTMLVWASPSGNRWALHAHCAHVRICGCLDRKRGNEYYAYYEWVANNPPPPCWACGGGSDEIVGESTWTP